MPNTAEVGTLTSVTTTCVGSTKKRADRVLGVFIRGKATSLSNRAHHFLYGCLHLRRVIPEGIDLEKINGSILIANT